MRIRNMTSTGNEKVVGCSFNEGKRLTELQKDKRVAFSSLEGHDFRVLIIFRASDIEPSAMILKITRLRLYC